jgi:hypothetical protein
VQGDLSEDASVALEARICISRVLQLWILTRHPISLFYALLRPGRSPPSDTDDVQNALDASGDPSPIAPMDDDHHPGKHSAAALSWIPPRGLAVAVAVLADICPPSWPSATSAPNKQAPAVRNDFAACFT